jgi:hypothetical protein
MPLESAGIIPTQIAMAPEDRVLGDGASSFSRKGRRDRFVIRFELVERPASDVVDAGAV